MAIRLGEILVERGVLTAAQVEAVLSEQSETHRPFGAIVERRFGVAAAQIEEAWSQQYSSLTDHVDARSEATDPEALKLVSARQAWQFKLVPLRFGEHDELIIVTTSEHLRRAFRFVSRVLERPALVLLTEPGMLGDALVSHYPMPGLSAEHVSSTVPLAVG